MVQGRVQEHAGVIPSGTLDANGLMQAAHLLQRLGDNGDIVLAEKGGVKAVIRPDNILDAAHSQFRQLLLRLNVEKDNGRRGDEEQTAGPTEVDVGSSGWGFDGLRGGIAEVLDIDLLGRGTEDCESIARNKDGGRTGSTLDIGWLDCTGGISWKVNQFVNPIVGRGSHKNGPLSGIVRDCTWGNPSGAQFAQRKHGGRLDILRKVI